MHAGRTARHREEVLSNFRRDEYRLLVATDVMGRGVDIPTITHVVIYDMCDIDTYVHRIGRTARGTFEGDAGHALTFFEYDPKWPDIADGLIRVLNDSQQEVPTELALICYQVMMGQR